jgi:nitrate reductase beta subunit
MFSKAFFIISIVMIFFGLVSCNPGKGFAKRYYNENKQMLDSIAGQYRILNTRKGFSIEFRDASFRDISFEMISDTFRYIYSFNLDEAMLSDSLKKYHYDIAAITSLIADMRKIRCTWINNLEYYEAGQKKKLVFVSVRHNNLKSLLQGQKYYALAFFSERQYFDAASRLTDRSEKTRIREINGQTFRKVTDRICYAITGNFR